MDQSVPAAVRHAQPVQDEADPWSEQPPEGLVWTRRWRGITGLTLLAIGLGLVVEEPALMLASVFGIAFAAYSRLGTAPRPTLGVEREIDDLEPAEGDTVSVTLSVTNEGEGRLRDLRIVDGVPPGLAVEEGTPRLAAALGPGESATTSYVLTADRGRHEFDPVLAVTRDATGATERVTTVAAPDRIACVPPLPVEPPSVPLRPQTTRYTGRTAAEEGGDGVEFHATREYRTGDPLGRIDWKRVARTGDLTTVNYRRERAASVLLVVDARLEAFTAADPYGPTAVDRCVEAARTVAGALQSDGHSVGLTALSPRGLWLTPGRGSEHRLALTTALGTHEAFARTPPAGETNVYGACREIRQRIADDTQVVFVSPLVDDAASDAALRFDAHGNLTTVISPDPTADATVGQQTAALARSMRLIRLRHAGLPVIDWAATGPFERALLEAHEGWSA